MPPSITESDRQSATSLPATGTRSGTPDGTGPTRMAPDRISFLRYADHRIRQQLSCCIPVLFHCPEHDLEQANLEFISCDFPSVPNNAKDWVTRNAMRSLVMQREVYEFTGDNQRLSLGSYPLSREEALVAVLADGSENGQVELDVLRQVGREIQRWDQSQDQRDLKNIAEDSSTLCELHQRLIASHDLRDLAKTLVVQLQASLLDRADRSDEPPEINVYCSVADEQRNLELVAASNSDQLPQDSERERIDAACAEAVCRESLSSWPPQDQSRQALLCHRKLVAELQINAAHSIPLMAAGGELEGVLLMTSKGEFNSRQIRFFQTLGEQAGDRLALVRRAEENRIEKAWGTLKNAMGTRRASWIWKILVAAILVLSIPMPYTVTGECELRPLTRRFVATPFDARLEECLVEPGEVVEAGQLLGTLDDREIRLELAQNQAELSRAEKNRDGYLASHESGQARLAQLEMEKLQARNDLLRQQIDNLQIKSPIDGVVVAGDLKDSLGMPLAKGDTMFEVAPLDQFTVEVHLPEDDVRFVQQDLEASLRFDALPFQGFEGRLKQIHPASQIRDHENIFVAIVELENSHSQMRPGMRGNYRIATVWRPLGWNYFRKPAARCLRWVGW